MAINKIYESLASSLEDRVELCETPTLYARDFGNLIQRQPKILAHVRSEKDICDVLQIANAYKMPVSIRGSGHSCNGQTLTTGIVLVHHQVSEEITPISILEDGNVLCPSRLTWESLERTLNKHNRSCPVLTDHLETTIGGTLSVGGLGIRSIQYGAQIDQVLKLKLILPTGKAIWCSPEENVDLFRFSLGGLGVLGVIESVILKTIPYKPHSQPVIHDFCNSIDAVMKVEEAFKNFIETAEHTHNPDWMEMALVHSYFSPAFNPRIRHSHEFFLTDQNSSPSASITDYPFIKANATKAFSNTLQNYKNIWCDYLLLPEQALQFAKFICKIASATQFFSCPFCIYSLAVKRPAYAPSLPLHPAPLKNTLYISVGLYCGIEKNDSEAQMKVSEMQKIFSQLLDFCIVLGGRPYVWGEHCLTHALNQKIYGRDYDRLLQLKREHDPNNIISFPNLWLSTCHQVM